MAEIGRFFRQPMTSLLIGLAVMVAATGPALFLLEAPKSRFDSALEKLVFATALGLGYVAYLIFLLGSLALLKKNVLGAWLVISGIIFIKPVFMLAKDAALEVRSDWRQSGAWGVVMAFVCAMVFFFALSGALAPATGQDELCYHLTQPKNYVREGRVYEVPFSINSLWPYFMEMLYTLGILLKGPELAKLFHFLTYLLCGGAVYSLARRLSGKTTGALAFLTYVLTPATFIQSSFAYVDNALACYLFLFVYAFFIYVATRQTFWAVVAGAMAGFAASIKYLGLFAAPIAILWMAAHCFKERDFKKNWRGALFFFMAFFMAGALWYGRSALLRKNPVFPFYAHFFGGHGWFDPTYSGVHGGVGLAPFLFFPWNLTLHPEWFGGESVGPAYLCFLPLFFLIRPKKVFYRTILSVLVLYSVLWFVVDPNVRFFFPALALAAVLTGEAVASFGKGVVRTLFFLTLIGQSLLSVYHFKEEFLLLFRGQAAREHYLSVKERSYGAATAINSRLKAADKILSIGEIRGYYFDNPMTLEGDFRRFTDYDRHLASEIDLAEYLKKQGFTHILGSSLQEKAAGDDGAFRLTRLLYGGPQKTRRFEKVFETRSAGVRYDLYRII